MTNRTSSSSSSRSRSPRTINTSRTLSFSQHIRRVFAIVSSFTGRAGTLRSCCFENCVGTVRAFGYGVLATRTVVIFSTHCLCRTSTVITGWTRFTSNLADLLLISICSACSFSRCTSRAIVTCGTNVGRISSRSAALRTEPSSYTRSSYLGISCSFAVETRSACSTSC